MWPHGLAPRIRWRRPGAARSFRRHRGDHRRAAPGRLPADGVHSGAQHVAAPHACGCAACGRTLTGQRAVFLQTGWGGAGVMLSSPGSRSTAPDLSGSPRAGRHLSQFAHVSADQRRSWAGHRLNGACGGEVFHLHSRWRCIVHGRETCRLGALPRGDRREEFTPAPRVVDALLC